MGRMPQETTTGGNAVHFQPTAWSMVRDAKDGSREALDHLMSVYWKPVYFFIRRRGYDVETSKDLTQGFFGSLLEREFFRAASPDQGRFRSYLLGALVHFLSDEKDKAQAKKRGGDLNFVQAEEDLASAAPTPEEAFRARWAQEILTRAMALLRTEAHPEDLDLLSGQARPDLTVTERKHRLYRLRIRLRERLREVLLSSVDQPGEVDSEIRELFSAFS
jgi:DNA-directed RNA polymerase specialized sigma24 family protein